MKKVILLWVLSSLKPNSDSKKYRFSAGATWYLSMHAILISIAFFLIVKFTWTSSLHMWQVFWKQEAKTCVSYLWVTAFKICEIYFHFNPESLVFLLLLKTSTIIQNYGKGCELVNQLVTQYVFRIWWILLLYLLHRQSVLQFSDRV